jgi:DNA-binding transcriptional MerR regulator
LIPVEKVLPSIPAKRYFTIGEVSELCGVKPYVLRYWEQEFTQLKPMKRRGNRRYYQHHEVLLIRRIRDLLYEQGFTISGARNQLVESAGRGHSAAAGSARVSAGNGELEAGEKWADAPSLEAAAAVSPGSAVTSVPVTSEPTWTSMRDELISIRSLLTS